MSPLRGFRDDGVEGPRTASMCHAGREWTYAEETVRDAGIFWSGAGGSLVIIDMDARTTFAYAMNRMTPAIVGDERSFRMLRAMWQAPAK